MEYGPNFMVAWKLKSGPANSNDMAVFMNWVSISKCPYDKRPTSWCLYKGHEVLETPSV